MPKADAVVACDVGNTRIALGCVEGEEVSGVHRLAAADLERLPAVLAGLWERCPRPGLIVACSTRPERLALVEAAAAGIGRKVLVVGREVPLPIRTDLAEPQRVGTDRLCLAAMAYHRLRQACVVADFGTAITIDCVSDEGVFLGGAILPGLAMSADALARGTALLPRVKLESPAWVFGKDTRQAIVAGIVRGARGAMRELTEAYASELGHWPPLIATGGDAELVAAGNDLVHALVPDLCLMGVALAYALAPPGAGEGDEP